MHLRQAGYKLRLVTGSGADVDADRGRAGDGLLLDHLAEVRLDQRVDDRHAGASGSGSGPTAA